MVALEWVAAWAILKMSANEKNVEKTCVVLLGHRTTPRGSQIEVSLDLMDTIGGLC